MASDLKENTSSDTIADENALLPKAAPTRVLVYVESDDDISFWRHILHAYESAELEFEINTATHKGKTGALERSNDLLSLKVGEYLIICVDSDYDYLLPYCTPESKLINENPYIFQTYSYSIENLQCFSESLHAVCVQAAKHDKRIINFNELLKNISQIIYPLFLWNLYFRKNKDHTTFTISDFCEIIKLTDKVDVAGQCAVAIGSLEKRVAAELASLEKDHPLAVDEINTLATSLETIGVNAENTYLFVHGHTLKDNVVLMVLKPVCLLLISEKMEKIRNDAQNKEQEVNEINQYKKQKQDISAVLNANTEFKSCFLFKKIKTDLDNYIATFS